MTKLTITEKQINQANLFYVQTSMSEIFSHANCSVRLSNDSVRSYLIINCPEEYKEIVRVEIADKIAEVIAIKYKNDYFKKSMNVQGLSKTENEILIASLIAADLEEDKKYCFQQVKSDNELAIDGAFNFKLKPLKKKWTDIVGYIPNCFLNSQLKEFIGYLLENKRKPVYVESGRVYDSHYRRLKRSTLLDGETTLITREILLSNCGEIRLSGSIPKEDEFYLKEFYNDKIIFSGSEVN